MIINPLALADFYKVSHYFMYPTGMTKLYSNLTPRKSRLKGVNEVVVFGFQYLIKEYLIDQWNRNFFDRPKDEVIAEYTRLMKNTIGGIDHSHVADLHDLGYLPIKIKALPEGSMCPIGVPCMTITNTHRDHAWLVNYLETLLSAIVWQPITSATLAHQYRKLLEKYALDTTGSVEGVQWQGHDFSFRGMSSVESAAVSGAAHLLSFTGTDTIPAITFLEQYYKANIETELVGASVPATEHSVMCMGEKASEIETFRRLLRTYPTGILSVVSDTWDLWKVLTEYLPALKQELLGRDGKLVVRPDSGDPVDILCGKNYPTFRNLAEAENHFRIRMSRGFEGFWIDGKLYEATSHSGDDFEAQEVQAEPEDIGVIELLWNVFGGEVNSKGYKVLNPCVGAIYGDSITLERAEQICERLKAKGFASTNVVLGIGSFTYQYNTRDTFGFAIKATYGEVMTYLPSFKEGSEGFYAPVDREIFKDPITDDGTKKSKKGLLFVQKDTGAGKYEVIDQVTPVMEDKGELVTIFKNSKLVKEWSLQEIRDNIRK